MSEAQIERKRRIQLAVWAYAYEVLGVSIVSDHKYDMLAREVEVFQETGYDELDLWFINNFDPSTGMWVHNHPHKDRLREICLNIIGEKPRAK